MPWAEVTNQEPSASLRHGEDGVWVRGGDFKERRHCSNLILMMSDSERAKLPTWYLTHRTLSQLNGYSQEVWEGWVTRSRKCSQGKRTGTH